MRNNISYQRCRGFSLVELTTAIFVFSIGMMAVLGLFFKCITSAREIYHYQLASEIIQSEIEFLRSLDYDQLKDCKDATSLGPTLGLQRLKNSSCKLTIEDYKDGGIKKVFVSLSWDEDKHKKSIKITTLIAERHTFTFRK